MCQLLWLGRARQRRGPKGSSMNRAELKEQIPQSQRKNTDKRGFTAKPVDLRKLSIYL